MKAVINQRHGVSIEALKEIIKGQKQTDLLTFR